MRALHRPFFVRTIVTTPIRLQIDPIQELYLREIRNYKPTPPSADEAESQTKSWSHPRPPKVPDTSSATPDEIQAYASEQVSVNARAGDEKFAHDFEEMFESWFDEPESEARMREKRILNGRKDKEGFSHLLHLGQRHIREGANDLEPVVIEGYTDMMNLKDSLL